MAATITFEQGHILAEDMLDYIITGVNQYIDDSGSSVDKIGFTFSSRTVLKAEDIETIKNTMTEIHSDIEWNIILTEGTILKKEHIQEILDNYQAYFCSIDDICSKLNQEGTEMLSMDATKGDNGGTDVTINWDLFLEKARWYRYDYGPKVIVKPAYTTTIEDLTPGNNLYAEGIGAATLKLDLLFMIDDSGSMRDDIDRVKSSIVKISDYLSSERFDARFAFCKYVDKGYSNQIDFTSDASYLEANIETDVWGGMEPAMNALMYAVNQDTGFGQDFTFNWRNDVNRIILLCTDETSDQDTFTPTEVATYYNNNDYRLIYSAEDGGRPYSTIYYGWNDVVPKFDNAIHTDLLRSATWRSIIDWITQLIKEETYVCDITVPSIPCLDDFPAPVKAQCGTASSLCLDILDASDIPEDEDICEDETSPSDGG